MTIYDQVIALTGTPNPGSTDVRQWVLSAQRSLVDLMTEDDLASHSTEVNVPITTGLNVSGIRVHKVFVGNYEAHRALPGAVTQLADNNSLLKSSTFTPFFIIRNQMLKTYNGANCAGTLTGIDYLTEADLDVEIDEEIPQLPDQLQLPAVLQTAILAKQAQINTLIGSINTAITATLTSLPTPLVSTLDISTQLARLESYILTDQDIELAQAEMGQIQTLIANWLQNTAGEVKIELEQSVLKLKAELETMTTKISNYAGAIQSSKLVIDGLQAQYNSLLSIYLKQEAK